MQNKVLRSSIYYSADIIFIFLSYNNIDLKKFPFWKKVLFLNYSESNQISICETEIFKIKVMGCFYMHFEKETIFKFLLETYITVKCTKKIRENAKNLLNSINIFN